MKKLLLALALAVLPLTTQARQAGSVPLDCNQPRATTVVSCYARVKTDLAVTPSISGIPNGYGPSQFHVAYAMPNQAARPVLLAIVVAYHDPNLSQDLHTYDAAYGLVDPPSFTQLSQWGDHRYPAINSGWALELSMDIETVHQTCQNCPLVVVEADSPTMPNLAAAELTAIRAGAKVISNSYGGSEFKGETGFDAAYSHPGVTAVVSSGDNGYGVSYPAASPGVVAAGGTTLTLRSNGQRLSESAWASAGSGCSFYEPKPVWQSDSGCAGRSVADISADADPATGAAVYDSLGYQGKKGWFVLGGTSLSAPLIAGMMALAGGGSVSALYQHNSSAHDIVIGSNGACGSYLCKARKGYDGPTGWGIPNGLTLFGGK